MDACRTLSCFKLLVFLPLALAVSGQASAWAYNHCGFPTVPIRWPGGYFQTVRNTCTIPPGSPQDAAYDNAITQMNKAVHVVSKYGDDDPSKCEVTTGDGYNQVGLADRAAIGGRSGVTFVRFFCTLVPGWITEIDTLVANDLPDFANPPEEAVLEQAGSAVFLHELGHAHGLEHDQSQLNVMGNARSLPLSGGTGWHSVLFPDDSAGLRAIYPEPWRAAYERNVFASPHELRVSDQQVMLNAPTPVSQTFCAGQPRQVFNQPWTVANGGQDSRLVDMAFWISPLGPPAGYSDPGSRIIGFMYAIDIAPQSVRTETATFALPDLPPGIYQLYHGVSQSQQQVEPGDPDTSDDVTHLATQINVIKCP